MKVKQATVQDLNTIVSFNIAMALESENTTLNPDIAYNGALAVFDNTENGMYFIIEMENIIIGSALITYEWSDWNNKKYAWLQSVYIVKEYRRIGAFSALLHTIKISLQHRNIDTLKLYVDKENTSALETYAHCGFAASHYLIYTTDTTT